MNNDRGIAEVAKAEPDRRRRIVVRPPILIYSTVYTLFYLVLLLPFGKWMPETLISLTVSRQLIGYIPPFDVTAVYFTGLIALWIGYLASRWLSSSINLGSAEVTGRLRVGWYITGGIVLTAFVAQIAILKTIPLLDISARWRLAPKLVALISLGIPITLAAIAVRGWKIKSILLLLTSGAMVVSLGTRSTPFVLILGVLFVVSLYATRRQLTRILIICGTAALMIIVVVGGWTKAMIYGNGSPWLKGIALLQTDSIGTFYNLQRLHEYVAKAGTTGGTMLFDTIANMVPGVRRDYANFQIGKILSGRSVVLVDGVEIHRSVSLTSTFVGPAYVDSGHIGVILLGLTCGALWGLFEWMSSQRRWFTGFFAYWAGMMFIGMYGGVYVESFILVTGIAFTLFVGILVLDKFRRHRTPGSGRHRR